MKSSILYGALLAFSFISVACNKSQNAENTYYQEVDSAELAAASSGPLQVAAAQENFGSICIGDYGIGIGGIYTSISELRSMIQTKVSSGALTHCVSISGQMLTGLTAPNGLFGPCIGAVSQKLGSMEQWSNCVKYIQ